MNNLVINTQDAIDAICDEFQYVYCHNCAHQDDEEQCEYCHRKNMYWSVSRTTVERILNKLPPAQPEIIHCRYCKHWNQATAYHGGALSFGFCESDDMWRSLYGETTEIAHIDTDDDFFCGYAERRKE